jgi:hypothetical protein
MSIFFTDLPKEGVKEPDFIVVYQESKVIDNETFLCNVWDAREAKVIKFEACSTETGEIFPIEWEYADFDKVFRFNPDLMNPNKREGRYHWIIERLLFCSDGRGGRKLTQIADATANMPQIPLLDPSVKIPTGKMPYAERAKLREDMNRLDKRRNENITARREATRARFMRWVSSIKEESRLEVQERQELIAKEREQRMHMQVEKRRAEEEERLRLLRLDQERSMKIEARDEDRRKRWNQGIVHLLEEGRLMEEQRQKEIEHAEASRKHQLDMAREQARALRVHTEHLDANREANYKKRQHRMHEASQMKMMQIKEQIKVINREEEVKQQRRSSAMHTFNLQRSQAYEVYMEKKRAREKLQNDEAAYDWLDLGPDKTKEEKPQATKAMESAEAEAKQSKARAQLEEQRRRQKLNKQRQKIFDKMEKKRSAYEVERHEKFVEKKAGQVESEKATIADLVKAWRERAIAQKAEKATKANEMRRKKNLREDNIQRRLEENTTLP